MTLTCGNCQRSLDRSPERAEGDWIIRCLFCGVKNIVAAKLEIVAGDFSSMPYQFKREPLTQEEATRLANACTTADEKLAVWTLLDTGLRSPNLPHSQKTILIGKCTDL